MKPSIEVEGAKELRRSLKRLNADLKSLRTLNKKAASVAAPEVKRRVRSRTGRLAASIRATGTQSSGEVRAGFARLPYAGVQNYGNPTKKGRLGVIRPQQFMQQGVDAALPAVVSVYRAGVNDIIARDFD